MPLIIAFIVLSLSFGLYLLSPRVRRNRRTGDRVWLRAKAKSQANVNFAYYDAFSDRRRKDDKTVVRHVAV